MGETVYLLIRHYSEEGVGTFDTTEAVYVDQTEAEVTALEKNESADRHPFCDYCVEPMPITHRVDAQGMTKADRIACIGNKS